jgi:transcription factor MBP1
MIFEFTPGNISPPPAPKHTTAKPKLPKKPAVPKWSHSECLTSPIGEDSANSKEPVAAPSRAMDDEYDNMSTLNDDGSVADDTTVASASYAPEDDRFDMSQQSTGHRKRKREDHAQSIIEQAHMLYSDELLDYFMLSHDSDNVPKPEPPINFRPDWMIDSDGHTALHWAAAMGDVEVMKELKRFNADLAVKNTRGETPLMRSVLFTNCQDKQTMPAVVKELISTIDCTDDYLSTALHHAAAVTSSRQKQNCARYYLEIILNKMQEVLDPGQVERILDLQDVEGNTAIHIAAKNKSRKCVRALMGRGARIDIPNREGVTAGELIQELNESRKTDRHPQASSSPYGPDSRSMYEMPEEPYRDITHISEAAMSIQSKITPLMLEKFQDLAHSFDEELDEKETSEKEARRILQSTQAELAVANEQILGFHRETADSRAESVSQLIRIENSITSLIEQQQKLRLWSMTQLEESKSNGHMMSGDDDLHERAMLAKMLTEEQNKRQKLVILYRDALAMAGAGEKSEMYRKLIFKTVKKDQIMDTMDLNLDKLIEELGDDDHEGEVILPDDI